VTSTSPVNAGLLVGLIVFYVAVLIFLIVAYVRVVQKSGFSGWWVLMGIVPIGNIIVLGLWAFKEWPIRRELEYLRGYAAVTGLPGYTRGPLPPGPDDSQSQTGS